MKKFVSILVFLTLFLSGAARAETLVLVQGYLGDAGSWRFTGIVPTLVSRGWCDGGHMSARGPAIAVWPGAGARCSTGKRLYTIDLPTEAPITVQTRFLAAYLARVAQLHKGEAIDVAAHSAGGVVARAALVLHPGLKVKTLITIASPHRGTGRAEQGLDVSSSPVGWFAPMFGAGTINRSRGLYAQLVRERPGTFLGWLNGLKHPQMRYVSVVRILGDGIVPAWSQDLNGVRAISGRAENYVVDGPHRLVPADGLTIANLLASK